MNKARINNFCGQDSMKLVEVMKKIDANASGILFIINEKDRLVGAISDGDIRRWLIKTADLDADIKIFMNKSPKYLYAADKLNALSFMKKKKIRAVPIVDEQRRILDIILDDDENIGFVKKDALLDVPVIIMAGGKGTRLYPYTKILPKPLIPIGDIPILERIINRFCEFGASEYYMTVNYKKNMIKAHFAELEPEYSI